MPLDRQPAGSFIHGAVGTANDQTLTSFYNGRDQLFREELDNGSNGSVDQTTRYAYDANGSQTFKSTASGDTLYRWDLRGHMVQVDNPGTTPDTTYGYDSNGVRVSETTGTTTTTYLSDPQNPTGYTKAVEEHTDTNGDGTAEAHRGYVLGLQVIA